jgi:NAD(P)-dependent dehydrogenase (short-subunit alcohol dehydrogenase family)
VFFLSQAAAKVMVKQGGGKIINIASMLSFQGDISVPSYTAAKRGVAGVTRALSENLVSNLVEIHRGDYQAAGLGDLGRPAGYVKRQIEGWTQRYVNARTDDIPDIERAAA